LTFAIGKPSVSSRRVLSKTAWTHLAWIIALLPLTSDTNGITIDISNRVSKKIKEE
jgi:hypothetical protein